MFSIDKKNLKIKMNKGDFGIILTFKFSDIAATNIKIIIYNSKSKIIEKPYTNISDNTIEFKLTEEESKLLETGDYMYKVYQYKDGQLKNTLLIDKDFIVEEGA